MSPAHLSKDQDIAISAGDVICVSTPGGGGYGAPRACTGAIQRDLALGYYTDAQARDRYPGVLPGA